MGIQRRLIELVLQVFLTGRIKRLDLTSVDLRVLPVGLILIRPPPVFIACPVDGGAFGGEIHMGHGWWGLGRPGLRGHCQRIELRLFLVDILKLEVVFRERRLRQDAHRL